MLKSELLRKGNTIEHAENYWKSFDGVKLYSQTWFALHEQRAIINLIHGFGEYSGRYSHWAIEMAKKGFTVRSYDMRGHGRSEGKRGYSSGYHKLLNDLELFINNGKAEYADIPFFLYGFSFGGNLAVNFAIQTNSEISGLIISSPWLELAKKYSPVKITLAKLIGAILPGVLVNNGIKAEDISRDLRAVHHYRTDPLVHDRIGIRLALQIMEAGRKASMSIYKINVPLLVMHGSSDNITSCRASRDFVRNAGERTTFIEWEGGFHELHNDLDQEKVFNSLVDWLDTYTITQKSN